MKKIIGFLLLLIIAACNTKTDNLVGHQLKNEGDKLQISYSGEGDVVQFKMFEGLSKVLEKNASGVFEGQLEIQNIDDGIFSYEIIVNKKDSLGKMTEIEYKPESEDEWHFLWVGKNRNIPFSKAIQLSGVVTNKKINSSFLGERRDLTIYTPKESNEETPIIYFTDGSIVKDYALYEKHTCRIHRIYFRT